MLVNTQTDGILVVERIGPATNISTSSRFRQTFYVFGGQSQSYRTFVRTGTLSSGTWKGWYEIMTSAGGTFIGDVSVRTSENNYIGIQSTGVPDVTSDNILPSSSRLLGIKMLDIAGNTIGQCRTQRATNGSANTSIIAYSTDGKKNKARFADRDTDLYFHLPLAFCIDQSEHRLGTRG
jgi:hypothetical protein